MNIYINTSKIESSNNNIKGVATLNFGNEFIAKNISIVEGKNGLFISYPSYKTKEQDTKGNPVYKDIIHPVNGFGKKISEAIINAFNSDDGRAKIELADESPIVSARMYSINQDVATATKGIGTIYINEVLAINNVTLVEGRNGLFVSMPSYKSKELDENKNPVYKNIAYPTSDGIKADINKKAVASFKEAVALSGKAATKSLLNQLSSKTSQSDAKNNEQANEKSNNTIKKGKKKEEQER